MKTSSETTSWVLWRAIQPVVRASLVVFVAFAFLPLQNLRASPPAIFRHQILILQSYNERYQWTKSIGEGISEALDPLQWDIWYEYLDAKNLRPDFDFAAFDRLLGAKYANRHFDAVVVVDDPAYLYFVRTRDSIFHGARTISLGLNAPPSSRLPGTSYIIEKPDFAKTINLALVQKPRATTVHVVVDQSITGKEIRSAIQSGSYARHLSFDWIDAGDAQTISERTAAIPSSDIIAFAVFFDPSQGYVSNNLILRAIHDRVDQPIYTFWKFNFDAGATGGFLYDGYRLGSEGAKILKDTVLNNAPPVYRDDTLSYWAFDWNDIERFGIPASTLPEGTQLTNQPRRSFEISQAGVVAVVVVIVVLGAFAALVLVLLRSQRRLVQQGELVIATQRELMASLGNVIETHSEETAGHVQRITRLSLLLADKLGLGKSDRTTLEIAAPMHDIGKIGIPDSILKKTGPLTSEEIVIMRTHTSLGYSIFASSPNPVFRAAAKIALEHHERWDGSGYPDGKSGETIDLLARIVAVVDVFDALLSRRVYKEPWEPERVRIHMEMETGRGFDPLMIRIVLDHFDEFLRCRASVLEETA